MMTTVYRWGTPVLLAMAGAMLPARADRPNFVVMVADDLGYHDIGANHPRTFYETPMRHQLHARYRQVNAQFLRAKTGGPPAWRPEVVKQ